MKEAEEILPEEPDKPLFWGVRTAPGVIDCRFATERYYRPVVLVALEKERKGSARVSPGFHLYRALPAPCC